MKLAKALTLSGLLITGGCGMNMDMDAETAGWVGAGGGMLLGGWAGSQLGGGTGQLIYTGIGALAGGSVGYETGRSLAVADWDVYKRAIFGTLDTPQHRTTWQNAETGTSGYVTLEQAYKDGAGRDCQAYRSTVAFEDEFVSGGGAACQNTTGNWTLVADAFQ
jgi:surface antigen